MAKESTRRRKVSFISRRKVQIPRRVSFKTKQGKRVSFSARKTVSKPVRVTFYVKSRKR